MMATVRQLLEAAAALRQMAEIPIKDNALLSFRVGHAINLLRPAAEAAEAAQSTLARAHARVEEGTPLLTPTGGYLLKDPEAHRLAWKTLADGEAEIPTLKRFNMHQFGKGFPWRPWWIAALADIGWLEDPEESKTDD
jgi:hypothetical protein